MTSRIATANRKLSKSSKAILAYLQKNRYASQKDFFLNLNKYTIKDIKAGIRILQEHELITEKPNLLDMRRVFYILT